jgi:Second Messenger Oligonucleotide or Dinucleotide Synthetase domain
MPFATVADAFNDLLKRIELNPARVTLASQRYNAVKTTIEGALPGKTVSQIGSFRRKTRIRPVDLGDALDIDAVVSFGRFSKYAGTGESGTTPSNALEIVRRALISNQTYRVMTPVKDHPVVTLDYADNMKIELIPAFVDGTGTHPHPGTSIDCYVIGTVSGNWELADYDYDAAMISSLNGITKQRLVPTAKIVKAYFRNVEMPLKSFHTELLVATIVPSIIADWDAKNYSYGSYGYEFILAQFLRRASQMLTNPVQLDGSFTPPVNSNLTQLRLAGLGTFLSGCADEAWRLAQLKDKTQALQGWRTFFGEPFPAN